MKVHEKVVLVGGGGGVYQIARHLKHVRQNITTIQTMFDHGGHSGKIRDENGVLPPGDIRQAILALSDDSLQHSLRSLLTFRFPKNGASTANATFGNLMLTALCQIYHGNMPVAIQEMSKIFGVQSKVLPVSLTNADLCATMDDGSVIKGEGLIDTRSRADERRIVSVHLEPEAQLYIAAYKELVQADKIVFCPGDLYTSVIPNLLVSGFCEAVSNSKAKLVYFVNIMTKKTETHGFAASTFARELLKYLSMRRRKFDAVVCHDGPIPSNILEQYNQEDEYLVHVDTALKKYSRQIIVENLLDKDSLDAGIIRHSSRAAAIIAQI